MSEAPETYSYLGPAGTFTWAALTQVPDAAGATRRRRHKRGGGTGRMSHGRTGGRR